MKRTRLPKWLKWPLYFVLGVLGYVLATDLGELFDDAIYNIGGIYLFAVVKLSIPFIVIAFIVWRWYKKEIGEASEEKSEEGGI